MAETASDKTSKTGQDAIPATPAAPNAEIISDFLKNLHEKKLIAEIDDLSKPIYKKIEFWQFISTLSIAVLTYFVLYFNGAFDTKTKYLEMQRNLLIQDIEKFKKDTVGYYFIKKDLENKASELARVNNLLEAQHVKDNKTKMNLLLKLIKQNDKILDSLSN